MKNGQSTMRLGFLLAFMIAWPLAGCSSNTPPSANTSRATNQSAKPGFINKVWKVNRSNSVAEDHLYVFLSEGTLVIASPQSKPAFGSWSYSNGNLTMTEESVPYKVDILKVTESEFHIRINNPGEPVEIEFLTAADPAA